MCLPACASKPNSTPAKHMLAGDYGRARMAVYEDLPEKQDDRTYVLDRMRLGALTLADGYTEASLLVFEDVYEMLRTQGINDDKTVTSVVINEDLKIWKGEPFEQALAMAYYGFAQAQNGSWDNARAAAANALFSLRDYTRDPENELIDTNEIARRSAKYEQAEMRGEDPEAALEEDAADDRGYIVRPSNFTLAYLLHGLASRELGREDESREYLKRVENLNPDAEELVETFRSEDYNTVLIVSWGLGPVKVGADMDDVSVQYAARSPSGEEPLQVSVNGLPARAYPVIQDINKMANQYQWNSLQTVRRLKSLVGTGMMLGGAYYVGKGVFDGDSEDLVVGAVLLGTGALLKAGAHADLRYCDAYPQRYYAVPLKLAGVEDRVAVEVDGFPASRLTLAGIQPPRHEGEPTALRYVRLVSQHGGEVAAPAWAAGKPRFSNDATGVAAGRNAPVVMGGVDARVPTERTLSENQAAGELLGLTLPELRDVLRERGVRWTLADQSGYPDRHVVEGGRSLVAPAGGTAGFARVFARAKANVAASVRGSADR